MMEINGGHIYKKKLPLGYSVRIYSSVCIAAIFGSFTVLVLLLSFVYFDISAIPPGLLLRTSPLKLNSLADSRNNKSSSNPSPGLQISAPLNSPAASGPLPISDPLNSPTASGPLPISFNQEDQNSSFNGGNGSFIPKSPVHVSVLPVDGSNDTKYGGTGLVEAGRKHLGQLKQCDLSIGSWVWDQSYPFYQSQNCPFIDGGFRCQENGRPDRDYMKWRWQPFGCDLPRFNARDLLERIRNRRVVFVGDSIGRNQWESLICMLAEAVPIKTRIYEVNGNPITKHKGFLSFRFKDYNCTVEYYRSPFLVYQGHPPKESSPEVRTTLRLNVLDYTSKFWANGDILVFNTGHWWNYEKTLRAGCYFQEGQTVNMTMDIGTAFQRAMKTLIEWIRQHANAEKTHVFLRSYAPVHFREGTWKTGGQCHKETQPEMNSTWFQSEPWSNHIMSEAVLQLHDKKNVQVLNITYLTEFRKDAHLSLYYLGDGAGLAPINRQDCSHWCLPGVPDTWNHLLYGYLLARDFGDRSTGVSKR